MGNPRVPRTKQQLELVYRNDLHGNFYADIKLEEETAERALAAVKGSLLRLRHLDNKYLSSESCIANTLYVDSLKKGACIARGRHVELAGYNRLVEEDIAIMREDIGSTESYLCVANALIAAGQVAQAFLAVLVPSTQFSSRVVSFVDALTKSAVHSIEAKNSVFDGNARDVASSGHSSLAESSRALALALGDTSAKIAPVIQAIESAKKLLLSNHQSVAQTVHDVLELVSKLVASVGTLVKVFDGANRNLLSELNGVGQFLEIIRKLYKAAIHAERSAEVYKSAMKKASELGHLQFQVMERRGWDFDPEPQASKLFDREIRRHMYKFLSDDSELAEKFRTSMKTERGADALATELEAEFAEADQKIAASKEFIVGYASELATAASILADDFRRLRDVRQTLRTRGTEIATLLDRSGFTNAQGSDAWIERQLAELGERLAGTKDQFMQEIDRTIEDAYFTLRVFAPNSSLPLPQASRN